MKRKNLKKSRHITTATTKTLNILSNRLNNQIIIKYKLQKTELSTFNKLP